MLRFTPAAQQQICFFSQVMARGKCQPWKRYLPRTCRWVAARIHSCWVGSLWESLFNDDVVKDAIYICPVCATLDEVAIFKETDYSPFLIVNCHLEFRL